MSRLRKEDLELLVKPRERVNLEARKYNYLGGPFLRNARDYIEILVYDTNDNFLESSIVNRNDYVIESYEPPKLKLKTGTILRKMGYDRGRFVVKYRFLRKAAGSPEALLIEVSGSSDIIRRENKYPVHEISPSRKEIRLMPQNISNDKYLRDFYNASRIIKKVRSNSANDDRILEFVGTTDDEKRASKKLKFVSDDVTLPHNFIGGTLSLDNSFVTKVIFATGPGGSAEPSLEIESHAEALDAQFVIDTETSAAARLVNASSADLTFTNIYKRFKKVDFEGFPQNTNGITIVDGTTNTLENIHELDESIFKVPMYHPGDEITFKSVSRRPLDTPTTYVWEFFGWDQDDRWQGSTWKYPGGRRIYSSHKLSLDDDISILSTSPTDGVIGGSLKARVEDSIDGSSVKVKLLSSDMRLGVALTISNSASTVTSTIVLPTCVRTAT